MASTEVSSVVGNIIEAFQNSLTVFKKGRRRKHKRRSPDTAIDEDKLVQDSLSERPREIRRSYDHYVAKHGRRFEVGDSSSQTCLAQILLVLNTGLIKLLNYALSHDSKSRVQSRTNIFTLSESAAMETLGALSELSTRLSSTSRIDMRLPRGGNENIISSRHRRHAKSPLLESPEVGKLEQYTSSGFSSSSQQLKKPPMSPQLPHGGWIRSKSDPSVVTVVTPSKPTAKRSDRKKSGSSRGQMSAATESSLDLLTTSDVSPPPVYSRHATRTPPTPKPKPEHLQMNVQRTPPILEPIHERQLQHQPSMYIVPSDFINTLLNPSIYISTYLHVGSSSLVTAVAFYTIFVVPVVLYLKLSSLPP